VFSRCTGCGACAEACPQEILAIEAGRHPVIEFTAACTFCGACAAACPEDVFDLSRDPPWTLAAAPTDDCLELHGVTCRACEDACEARALRARPRRGGTAVMSVDVDACTGCGGCIAVCPTDAIRLVPPSGEASHAR
jgi:ferredoxin-type protein NapF